MKSLIPWVCIFAASTSQQLFADPDFNAYRLGNYDRAVEPLISKTGKDAVADYYLGRLYLYGYGPLKNTDLATRYFLKSAEKGYLPAVQWMARYSLMYEKNPEQATRWFKEAASKGDINAQLFMAASYLYGVGVKKNVDTASRYYIDAAKSGNPIAQYALAENFLESRHSSNYKLGMIWLSKSAAQNNPKALTKLGSLYLEGKKITKDVSTGSELLNKAAVQNYGPAMVQLGDLALAEGHYDVAVAWYNKAVVAHDPEACLHLAHAYLQEKSPIYDAKSGFLWTLKAAQDGVLPAKKELGDLYHKGIGVAQNDELSEQWLNQAAQDEKKKVSAPALAQAALWLSNNQTDKLEEAGYQMNGIMGAWKNPLSVRNNTYNQAPQMEMITRQDLFKPQFVMLQPDDISLNQYFDALVSKTVDFPANQWTYPSYPLNPTIEAMEKIYSPVVAKINKPAPYMDASYPDQDTSAEFDSLALWTDGWQQQVNFMSVFNQLYFRAILGDSESQFQIGQMFQYGIGVAQNDQSAAIFYQNAAEQLHLGAEYNLGILYLQHAKDESGYQSALNWLTDSAFKGNKKAQYVLSRILTTGVTGADGKEYIKPNPEQAKSMLYLSAANNYGPAEYELAEYLSRENINGLSVEVKQHKIALVRQLYENAVSNGVAQALLPLAFYNAMDTDKNRQNQSFQVAENEANIGNERAALLLGMLYDRGIGTGEDPAKAIYWYQQAGVNPVSQFILGTYITEGKNIAADKERGKALLQQSADAAFSFADINLAVLLQQSAGDFLPQLQKAYSLGNSYAGILIADYYLAENETGHDPAKMQQAKEIYTGLAEKGDPQAQLKLAYMFDKGIGSPVDSAAAERWYTASAVQGDALSQYLLGQFYQKGEMGEPDYAKALDWYHKASSRLPEALVAIGFIYETVDDNYPAAMKAYETAATLGDRMANYNLGLIYEYGKGGPVNYPKAKQLFTSAADKGSNEAMTQLAGMYFYGLGEARNEQQALVWYKKAAALGNSNALYALGLLSETGVATKLDFPDALKYYQEASDKGNERAMLALARMYHYGLGVAKDTKAAVTIYQKLADRQNAYAQYQLGTYYLDGTAGERMPDKARALLQQASENGSPEARQALQRLDAQMQGGKVSFVEPILMNHAPVQTGRAADIIYLDALNQWNQGDETMSRMILHRLVTQYPNFVPAKRAFDHLNHAQDNGTYGLAPLQGHPLS